MKEKFDTKNSLKKEITLVFAKEIKPHMTKHVHEEWSRGWENEVTSLSEVNGGRACITIPGMNTTSHFPLTF